MESTKLKNIYKEQEKKNVVGSKQPKQEKKGQITYVVVYFTEDKSSFQVIRPSKTFYQNPSWNNLVQAVTGGVYNRYELR